MAEFIRDTKEERYAFLPITHAVRYAEYRCECGKLFETVKVGTLSIRGRIVTDAGLCPVCWTARANADEEEQQRIKYAKQAAVHARETVASIPPHFAWASFDATELEQRVSGRAIAKARRALDALALSVVIVGPARSGKTSLACALLRAMAAKRDTVGLWVTTFKLATARREQRFGTGEAESIVASEEAGVLLIDELCAEQGRDTALDEVIRTRHDYDLPTIYTCGFPRKEIETRYGAGVSSRILDGSIIIQTEA